MMMYIAKYQDSMYPEDNYTLGVYFSEVDANNAIDEATSSTGVSNPNYNRKKKHYYYIDEMDINLPDELINAIEGLIAVAKTSTYGNVIKSDDAIDALGLNPYCVNEGRCDSDEKVSISRLTNILEKYEIV